MKRPLILVALIAFALGLIILINNGLTGYTVYGKLSSIFSGNALSAMAPTIVLATIFAVSIVALRNTIKK